MLFRSRTSESNVERGPFAWLLITQVVFVAMSPVISSFPRGRWIQVAVLFAILIAGVYAAAARRGFLIIALFLLVPALFAWLGPDVFSVTEDEVSRLLSAAACFAFTAVVVTAAVAGHRNVSRETIIGGIDVYLLIGMAFMFLHQAVGIANPAAYTMDGKFLSELSSSAPEFPSLSTMLYFSFTTLTTLGYGDIVPRSSIARLLTSTESVMGQLYVAIFIARLVSIQVSQRIVQSRRSDES